MANRPAFQFYPADWRSNANLRRCSLEARGAWIEVLCVLHDSDEYGVLRWPLEDIAQAVAVPVKVLKELVAKKVLKGADAGCEAFVFAPRHAGREGDPVTLLAASDGPCWYCSRFVKDEYVRSVRGGSTRFTAESNPKATTADERTERARLRAKVLEKTGGYCHHCKCLLDGEWHIDHLIPTAKGGPNTFDNLVPACVACNHDKSDSLPSDWSPPTHAVGTRQGDGPSSSASSSASKPLASTKRVQAPACPHADIVALYHECLPAHPAVKVWGDDRQAQLRKRWREDPKRQSLDYWRRFFLHVGKSPFLTGKTTGRDGRSFLATLDWLVGPQNFAKVIEGRYHDRG